MMAVQRYADGDDIAGMVSYLASPEGAFVTGASLKIEAATPPDTPSKKQRKTTVVDIGVVRCDYVSIA
jgi:NAD(P)-dependent dehydrogenase (short-subunit alcohol dehydrogenase family)